MNRKLLVLGGLLGVGVLIGRRRASLGAFQPMNPIGRQQTEHIDFYRIFGWVENPCATPWLFENPTKACDAYRADFARYRQAAAAATLTTGAGVTYK